MISPHARGAREAEPTTFEEEHDEKGTFWQSRLVYILRSMSRVEQWGMQANGM